MEYALPQPGAAILGPSGIARAIAEPRSYTCGAVVILDRQCGAVGWARDRLSFDARKPWPSGGPHPRWELAPRSLAFVVPSDGAGISAKTCSDPGKRPQCHACRCPRLVLRVDVRRRLSRQLRCPVGFPTGRSGHSDAD